MHISFGYLLPKRFNNERAKDETIKEIEDEEMA